MRRVTQVQSSLLSPGAMLVMVVGAALVAYFYSTISRAHGKKRYAMATVAGTTAGGVHLWAGHWPPQSVSSMPKKHVGVTGQRIFRKQMPFLDL